MTVVPDFDGLDHTAVEDATVLFTDVFSGGMNVEAYNAIKLLTDLCADANQNWWVDPATGEPLERNRGQLLMLAVSELAEAMEGDRKDLMDDKLPHRKMFEVELADALIRIFDMAAHWCEDLPGAFVEKTVYNAQRADHKHEQRLMVGSKKY